MWIATDSHKFPQHQVSWTSVQLELHSYVWIERQKNGWTDMMSCVFHDCANAPAKVTESSGRGTLRITQVSAWFKRQISWPSCH